MRRERSGTAAIDGRRPSGLESALPGPRSA